MSATVFLWDDSHWGDIPTARDGMVGYTHKLTDGLRYYEDPEYRAAMNAVRPMGFTVLGAYHMLHGGVSVTEQARWFVARASVLTPWWRDWPYWVWQIDAEPLAYLTRPSVAECNAFGEAVMAESGAPRNSVLGYLASWSYGSGVQLLQFPFWNSNYGSNPAVPYRQAYPGNDSPRWVGGGRRGDFLQYGSRTIVAGQPTSDASAFAGTLDALKAFLRPTQEEDDVAGTWYFQLADLRIGRANGCTIEYGGRDGTTADWDSWRQAHPEYPVLWGQDPGPYDAGVHGRDITKAAAGGGDGVNEQQVRLIAADVVAGSKVVPPSN